MGKLNIDSYIAEELNRALDSPAATVVYLYLWACNGTRKKPAFLSHQNLADATGISKSTIQRAVRQLEEAGYISVTRLGDTHAPGYTLLRPWLKSR